MNSVSDTATLLRNRNTFDVYYLSRAGHFSPYTFFRPERFSRPTVLARRRVVRSRLIERFPVVGQYRWAHIFRNRKNLPRDLHVESFCLSRYGFGMGMWRGGRRISCPSWRGCVNGRQYKRAPEPNKNGGGEKPAEIIIRYNKKPSSL